MKGGDKEMDNKELSFLHEKELILNKQDTENFLKSVEIMKEIADKLPKIKAPENIKAEINVDAFYSSKNGTESLFRKLNEKLNKK
jgi:hypothetical protein